MRREIARTRRVDFGEETIVRPGEGTGTGRRGVGAVKVDGFLQSADGQARVGGEITEDGIVIADPFAEFLSRDASADAPVGFDALGLCDAIGGGEEHSDVPGELLVARLAQCSDAVGGRLCEDEERPREAARCRDRAEALPGAAVPLGRGQGTRGVLLASPGNCIRPA